MYQVHKAYHNVQEFKQIKKPEDKQVNSMNMRTADDSVNKLS